MLELLEHVRSSRRSEGTFNDINHLDGLWLSVANKELSATGFSSITVARSRAHCSSLIGQSLMMYLPSTSRRTRKIRSRRSATPAPLGDQFGFQLVDPSLKPSRV
jgi:hypothetical protein